VSKVSHTKHHSFCIRMSLATTFLGMVLGTLLLRSSAFTFSPASQLRFQKRQLASLRAAQKVVFLGTPDVAARSLEQLHSAAEKSSGSFEVSCVISQPAQMMGRGKKRVLTPSPVEAMATTLGIPVLSPEKAKDEGFLQSLEAMCPDLCITAAYGQYLPKRFLNIPRCGTLNIHPSLLPRWRGASPVQRSLEAGDEETGVSVLWTVSKMDAGNIAAQERKVLAGSEKAPELLNELFATGTRSLIELLPRVWSGECTPSTSKPQAEEGVVAADKITVEEAQVNFSVDTARDIHNKVRGFAGWPGVVAYLSGGDTEETPERYKLVTTRVAAIEDLAETTSFSADTASMPWTNDVIVERGRMFILSAPDSKEAAAPYELFSVLEVLEIQAEAKKAVNAKAFTNGLRGKKLRWLPLESNGGLL